MRDSVHTKRIHRRNLLRGMLGGAASLSVLDQPIQAADANLAAIAPKDHIKITKIETFPVNRTRSVFLNVHTDAGIVGLGEPSLEGWSPTVAKAAEEMADYLVGKDPRQWAVPLAMDGRELSMPTDCVELGAGSYHLNWKCTE